MTPKISNKKIQKSRTKLLESLDSDLYFHSVIKGLSDDEKINSILEKLSLIDPTVNNKYLKWIIREYSRNAFRVEDSKRVQLVLNQFISIKNKISNNDINQYTFHDLESTMDDIFNADIEPDNVSDTFPEGSTVLYNGPLGWLAIPETKEASCELGRGTKWCTAARENNMFDQYNDDEPLYIWRDAQEGGAKYQFHFKSGQFMDAQDRPISTDKLNYFRTEHPIMKKLFSLKEKEISKDPKLAYNYAYYVLKGRFPEGEPAIAKSAEWAYLYTKNIIKGRWSEGESAISRDPEWSYKYAKEIIKGRFPEGEPAIAADELFAYEYAEYVIKGRFPLGETAIAKEPEWALDYARNVIKGRFPEGEPAITEDPDSAFNYALYIIKGRFKRGEPAIAKEPDSAYNYARYIIKGRWPEGELSISKSAEWVYYYARDIIKGRWPKGEPAISEDHYWAYYYEENIIDDSDFWEKLKDPSNHEYN